MWFLAKLSTASEQFYPPNFIHNAWVNLTSQWCYMLISSLQTNIIKKLPPWEIKHIEMLRILTRLESTYGVIFRNFPMVPHTGIVLPKPILSSSHLHEKPTIVRFELGLMVKALKPLGHEPNYQSAICFKLSLSLFTQSHSPSNNFQQLKFRVQTL